MLDRLASAVEGLALAQDVPADAVLAGAHQLRRTLRHLPTTSGDASALAKARRGLFIAAAQLVVDLDHELGPQRGAPLALLNALRRAADGLDYDYPLRQQPNNIKRFLGYAAEALGHMSAGATSTITVIRP